VLVAHLLGLLRVGFEGAAAGPTAHRVADALPAREPVRVTLPPGYFDGLYATSADPWGFTERWYEERKRALTMAALPVKSYRRGFEPGCSLGVLTAELAGRCGSLVSTDVSAVVLERAGRRVPENVELRRWALGDTPPEGSFDLVVLSEVGYYLDARDLRSALDGLLSVLEDGGTLLACHWRHPVADYPQSGDAVHAAVGKLPGLVPLGAWRDEDVVIEVWEKGAVGPGEVSVARREGLVGE